MRRTLRCLAVMALATLALQACAKKKADPATPAPTEAKPAAEAAKAAAAGAKAPAAETGPVASVNGVDVPRGEFDEMFEKMTRVYTKREKEVPDNVARRHKQNILKRLIEKELLRQNVAKAKIEVSDAELEDGLSKYKEMFRTEANFERYLKNSKTDLEKIKGNIRYNRSLDKLLEADGQIAITEGDAKDYFEKNKRRYEEKEAVKASHILLKVADDADKAADDKAKGDAARVAKLARKKGVNFAEIAQKHSQGPTARKGGNLGYFTRGRMEKAFEETAFRLKPGRVSKPVRTKFGWHVIKVFDHRSAGQKEFSAVKDSILKLLESRERRLRKSKLLRELRETANIVKHVDIPDAPKRPREGAATLKPTISTATAAKLKPAAAGTPASAPAATPAGAGGGTATPPSGN